MENKMELEELKIIATDSDSKIGSVNKLIEGGVSEEDAPSVLEMREILTFYRFSEPKRSQIAAQPTINAMIKAYHDADDDLDNLEAITQSAISNVHTPRPTPSTLNAVLFSAAKKFKNGGLDALDID